MKSGAATVAKRFAHEGQAQAVFKGDLAHHQFEVENIIDGRERVSML